MVVSAKDMTVSPFANNITYRQEKQASREFPWNLLERKAA